MHRNFHEMTFREKPIVFFLQSLKGKSKGFSTAKAEVMDICGAGGTASKFTEKMPLDPF